jgi:hypothetical protein
MLLKVIPLEVEPKRWGNNANMVSLTIYNKGYMKERK